MFHPIIVRFAWPIVIGSGLLLASFAAGTGWYIHQQQQQASQLLNRSVSGMRAAEELEVRTREIRTSLNQFVVTGDKRYLLPIPKMLDENLEWLKKAENLKMSPNEAGLIDQIRTAFQRFLDRFHEIRRQIDQPGQKDEALDLAVSNLIDEQITRGVLIHVHEFLERNQHLISETIPVNQEAADRVGFGLAALGIIGAVTGLLFGYIGASRFHQSLVQLSVPVHDAAGKLSEVVGPVNLNLSGVNLTEMQQALHSMADHVGDVVNRFQQSQREALRAEQLAAVGQLAAGMAHELRNPLTAIKMIVQAAIESPSGTGVTGKSLQVLYEQILRQENSLRSFLEYARPPRLETQRFDLSKVVVDCLNLMQAQAERQGVKLLSTSLSDTFPADGDAAQIRQVLVNLVGNAIDALAGKGTIEIELQACSSDLLEAEFQLRAESIVHATQWNVLSVSDDGPGLPGNLGDRIFEPFVSTKETGTGLGLSICRRIVEMHQGVIVGRNRPGGGAQFVICLPAAPTTPAITSQVKR